MFREDFVLRHIRLFVQVIARILGLIEAGDSQAALELVETSFRDYLGMEMDAILPVPDNQLVDFMTFGEMGANALDKCGFAIALLYRAAQLHRAAGRPDQGVLYAKKAFSLFLEVMLAQERSPEMPSYSPALADLLGEVPMESLHEDTLGALMFFYERNGNYDLAEEVLLAMIARDPANGEIRDLGISFYRYLLEESPQALAAGNFSLEQAATGLHLLESGHDSSSPAN